MTSQRDETIDQDEVPNSSSAGNFDNNDDDATESVDLITQREKIQKQILALEKYFEEEGHSGLSACSSSDEESENGVEDLFDGEKGLDAQHLKIQREIRELEETLGLGTEEQLGDNVGSSEIPMSEDDSDDEDFELPMNTETCLEMNLVYQEVVKEKLAELEQLLKDNKKQQKELEDKMLGPAAPNQPTGLAKVMYIGYFMKPYFKDKVTGLGPPDNPETKEKRLSGTQPCDEKSIKRWEGWQKSLLINAIVQDTMKRLLQPKMSKMEYLKDKIMRAKGPEKEPLLKQIQELDAEISHIRALGEDDLMGERHDDHDWDKIANIDFEGKREAEDVKLFWQNYLHPSINKSAWKTDEIEKLKSIVEEHKGRDWEAIAEEMGTNRTAFMCFQTSQRYILKEFRKRAWTAKEDDQLRHLIERKRIGNFIPYTQISYFMDGREAAQLIYRWTQVLDPTIKKGPWSRREDELLIKSVEKHGVPNWWRVKFEVPGRTDSQCRDRYLDCLSTDVRKGPWTEEEENLLKQAVEKHGVGKWAKIASEIPYRIDCQCLQKWRSLIKRTELPGKSTGPKYKRKSKKGKKAKKVKKKKRTKNWRGVFRWNKGDDDPSDEEDLYYESDAGGEEFVESEEEPEPQQIKYVQTHISEWIPKKTKNETGKDAATTTERLRIFLVKTPEDTDVMNDQYPQLRFKCPAYYTILSAAGNPVERIKRYQAIGQQDQTAVKRTFDEDMILVPQGDVKKLYQLVLTRAFKPKPKEQEGTTNQNTPDTCPEEGTSEDTAEESHEDPNEGVTENTSEGSRPRSVVPATQGQVVLRPIIAIQHLLKAAISPWMGHLLLPLPKSERRKLEADVMRERTAEVGLTSTEVLVMFLKVLYIDTVGCKKVISMRKVPCVTGKRGELSSVWRQPGNNSTVVLRRPTTATNSQPLQPSPIRPQHPQQQQFQQVLIPILQSQLAQQPQQAQNPQPNWTQSPSPLARGSEASKASPQLPLQAQSSGNPQAQPQLQFPQMPQLFIPPGLQLAQPMLMAINPVACPMTSGNAVSTGPVATPSTCSETVSSQSTGDKPASSKGKSRKSPPVATRPSKRARKPTSKAKLLMEEEAAKAKNKQQNKRPRLEGPSSAPPPLPFTWILAPAQVPMNALNGSNLVGTSTLPCPPTTSASLSSSSPATSTSTATQANVPLNMAGMFPGGVVFALSNVPVSSTAITRPSVTTASSTSASTSSTTVTTSSPSVQERCATASPGVSHIRASSLAGSLPALPLTPARAQRPQPLQGSPRLLMPLPPGFQRTSGSPHPVAGAYRTLTPVVAIPQPVAKPLPAVTQNGPLVPDSAGRFDPSLMFMEDKISTLAWMKKRKSVLASESDDPLPYLPPFVSSINALQSLLVAKSSLFKHSLRILPNCPKEATRNSRAEEQMSKIRSVVKEKFSDNPAYQTLKARFLSCFAMPALLATIDPALSNQVIKDEDDFDDDDDD